jgi:hypothetical protein
LLEAPSQVGVQLIPSFVTMIKPKNAVGTPVQGRS